MLELDEEVITELDKMRLRLTELGAKRMEVLEKKRGGDLVCTVELWRMGDEDDMNEATLWTYPNGEFKLFGLLDPEEY